MFKPRFAKKPFPGIRTARLRQAGWGTMEAALGAAAAIAIAASAAPTVKDGYESMRAANAAAQYRIVRTGFEEFVTQNYATLQTQAAGGPVTVTMTDLEPWLGTGVGTKNTFNQDYVMQVRLNGAGKLETLLKTTGGEVPSEKAVALAASKAGADVGFSTLSSSVLQGGSKADLGNWGMGGEKGALASVRVWDQGRALSDYVYRRNIGNPDANTMFTDLNMGGNDIVAIKEIKTQQAHITGDATIDGNLKTASLDATALTADTMEAKTSITIGSQTLTSEELKTLISLHETKCPAGMFLTKEEGGFRCLERTVPKGTVAYFNTNECPADTGWIPFTAGQGRTIIGTNAPGNNNLSGRGLLETGGAESVYLGYEHMPSGVWFEGIASYTMMTGGPYQHGTVDSMRGSGQKPLSVMNPYVALTVCEKT